MKNLIVVLVFFVGASECLAQQQFSLSVVDSETAAPVAARVYLTDAEGKPYYFKSNAGQGTAFRYEKQNWIHKKSVEFHTTVSAHSCKAEVPSGTYQLIVERGKEYFPSTQEITVVDADIDVQVSLRRWINMADRGWYSGDTHIHRNIQELRNIVSAEDLNVVFPLTNWVTISNTPPSAGDKNLRIDLPNELVRVDDTHVIWPRNTEYEIFSVAKKRHTLGALFVLGHEDALHQTVPPWKPVIAAARAADPDVLFDMDKLAWPFAMVLPTIAPNATYEIANNHMWRTEFAFRDWYTPTPNFIQPPFGNNQGDERDWIDFTLGMYYVLLDSGFRLPPSAGTANGVHPVPAGFGRVYVHQPSGFDYQQWRKRLQQGRSFVTTGPMLLTTAGEKDAGHVFLQPSPTEIPIHVEVISETPLSFGEVIVNGVPERLLRAKNIKTREGAFRTVIDTTVKPNRSGWFAVRFWEDRPNGRVRFAHSAPWYVELNGEPVLPRAEEKDYLIDRMKNEIQRSRSIVSAEGMSEYEDALSFYQSLSVFDDDSRVATTSRPVDSEDGPWIRNMVIDHRFTPHEVRLATGIPIERARDLVARLASEREDMKPILRVLPFPGGRHPRRSFLDGAINPQRETKVSVFPPWANGGYAVVDVPEAIFSNLGLTYLAHSHIATIWSDKNIQLEKREWKREGDAWIMQRELPNGIEFGSRVEKKGEKIAMEMWLRNGTDQALTGLRTQVCTMLSGLIGFNAQRKRESVVRGSFIAVKGDVSSKQTANRWIITAWQPLKRTWANPPVPCIHSDPVFDDCDPGETVHVQGGMWFYEGGDIESKLKLLQQDFESQSDVRR